MENLNFGQALEALKQGKKVTRAVWGGYWMMCTANVSSAFEPAQPLTFTPLIVAVLKDNGGLAAAQPYQSDLLAEDWKIID